MLVFHSWLGLLDYQMVQLWYLGTSCNNVIQCIHVHGCWQVHHGICKVSSLGRWRLLMEFHRLHFALLFRLVFSRKLRTCQILILPASRCMFALAYGEHKKSSHGKKYLDYIYTAVIYIYDSIYIYYILRNLQNLKLKTLHKLWNPKEPPINPTHKIPCNSPEYILKQP